MFNTHDRNIPSTFQELCRFLGGKLGRKLMNNTVVFSPAKTVADIASSPISVRLHSTIIVTLYPDKKVVLNSGGYHTATTKQRINIFAHAHGYTIYQERYQWFIRHFASQQKHDFFDGIAINQNGELC